MFTKYKMLKHSELDVIRKAMQPHSLATLSYTIAGLRGTKARLAVDTAQTTSAGRHHTKDAFITAKS